MNRKEINKLKGYIKQKERENIFILWGGERLEYGEIEDFLPEDYKNLDGIIELIKEDKFQEWLENDAEKEKRGYLEKIVHKILD